MRLIVLVWLVVVAALILGAIALAIRRATRPDDKNDIDDGDKAMAASYLAARGPATAESLRLGMGDFTRGEQDWSRRKTLRHVYRLLDRLESEGTVVSDNTPGGRTYRLTRPDATLPVP